MRLPSRASQRGRPWPRHARMRQQWPCRSRRREKEGASVVNEIKKLGGDAAFIRTDIAKDADVKAMVDFTVEKFGRLDLAFNNAGVEWKGPLHQAAEAEYRRV